jgi:chemotaxis protein histidine kinase CheA
MKTSLATTIQASSTTYGHSKMVTELVMKERLEGLVRVLKSGNVQLTEQIILAMIDEIDLQVEQFEEEVEAYYGC